MSRQSHRNQPAARESATSQEPARIRAMFSAIAPRYDFGNHLLSANIDRLWRRRAVRVALEAIASGEGERPLGPQELKCEREGGRGGDGEHGQAPIRILDCCAGTCDLALAFARAARGAARVVGCDFAIPMLRIARDKIARDIIARGNTARAEHVTIAVAAADTLRLPFADESFDVAAVAFGLRNLADREAGLGELRRVVRPGGVVMVLEFSQPPNRVFRALYYFYFCRLLPLVARLGTGSRQYGYLPASVIEFPGPRELAAMMERAGLRAVRYELLTGGIAAIHIGARRDLLSRRRP